MSASTSAARPIVRPRARALDNDERERLHVLSSWLWTTADYLDDEHLHALAAATRDRAGELHAMATRHGGAVAPD